MTEFTPVSALLGGTLIGLAAVLFMFLHGRIAGISGIAGGLLTPRHGDILWRVAFIAGLAAGAMVYQALPGATADISVTGSPALIIAGGLIVGFGTRLGSGCTSGHGVCGMARLSPRSLAATATFMATAVITVFIARHWLGA